MAQEWTGKSDAAYGTRTHAMQGRLSACLLIAMRPGGLYTTTFLSSSSCAEGLSI